MGVVIRCIGYGVMIKLYGVNNSMAELFVVQLIQGAGSSVVQTTVVVVAQVVVPHLELTQATALPLLFVHIGNGFENALMRSIYTNTLAGPIQNHLEGHVAPEVLNNVINTLNSVIDDPLKTAVNHAYSDVVRYMAIAGLVASTFSLAIAYFLPNTKLSVQHNVSDKIEISWRRKSRARRAAEL